MRYVKLSKPNQISMPRGDSDSYEVGIVVNGEEYTPTTGDKVRFAMRRPDMDANKTRYLYPPLIVKEIPTDTMLLTFLPEDTKPLPFGRYVYDMEITFADGDVRTFVKESPFIIEREVE